MILLIAFTEIVKPIGILKTVQKAQICSICARPFLESFCSHLEPGGRTQGGHK